jgi:uncharacterized membrane protein
MTRTVRIVIFLIALLSIFFGIYLAYEGSEFIEYFIGIIVGILLLATIMFSNKGIRREKIN